MSRFFSNFLAKNKCSDCGKVAAKGIIVDWQNQLPWCADCFKKLLEDQRTAAQAEAK